MLGKLLGGVEGRSLQFIGLGMYEKFPQAMVVIVREIYYFYSLPYFFLSMDKNHMYQFRKIN
jgi:hypothetical protein